jgi:hypothetical protein
MPGTYTAGEERAPAAPPRIPPRLLHHTTSEISTIHQHDDEDGNVVINKASAPDGGHHAHDSHDDGDAEPPAERPPLSRAISARTRAVHARLNKLILARLPLALPPHARDPGVFVTGLLHMTVVYAAFEGLWREMVKDNGVVPFTNDDEWEARVGLRQESEEDGASSTTTTGSDDGGMTPRMRSLLAYVRVPGISRTARLRHDIRAATGWSEAQLDDALGDVCGTAPFFAPPSTPVGRFVDHARRAVGQRPHVVLAYAYTLHMALFAGGRHIRAALEGVADAQFWKTVPMVVTGGGSGGGGAATRRTAADGILAIHSSSSYDRRPFQFLRFSTPTDGEDLKADFKARLAEVETRLSWREHRDVLQEAACIFENMILLVGQLDGLCEGVGKGEVEGKEEESEGRVGGGEGGMATTEDDKITTYPIAAAAEDAARTAPTADNDTNVATAATTSSSSRRSSFRNAAEWLGRRLRDSVAIAKERTEAALGKQQQRRGGAAPRKKGGSGSGGGGGPAEDDDVVVRIAPASPGGKLVRFREDAEEVEGRLGATAFGAAGGSVKDVSVEEDRPQEATTTSDSIDTDADAAASTSVTPPHKAACPKRWSSSSAWFESALPEDLGAAVSASSSMVWPPALLFAAVVVLVGVGAGFAGMAWWPADV